MKNTLESKSLDELLAEADEVIRQIDTDTITEMKEEHRLELEKQTQNLGKIKSQVQGKTEKNDASDGNTGADRMHEAIVDIVKAMHGLKSKVF